MSEQFSEQQKEALQLLKTFHDNNILEHVVLVGSWAEYFYAQTGLLPGFTMTLRTIDIDFLVKNKRRPIIPIDIPTLAKQNGYAIAHDILEGTTKFFTPGGLEVEFLIPQRGKGNIRVQETNLGVQAQALRHMSAIVENAITVNFYGIKIQIPSPEVYVLTKMIINEDRKEAKKRKDMNSVIKLLPFLDFTKIESLYTNSTKKERASICNFAKTYTEEIKLEVPGEIVEKLETILETEA